MDIVKEKLKTDTDDSVKFVKIGESSDGDDIEGLPMKCYNTECVFEILVYKYCGSFIVNNDPPLVSPPKTSPGKITARECYRSHYVRDRVQQ